ncbi:MAG: hemerythrin domain-containing protein [Ignavibacteria bacterium]|nr:hemerythrin domain-containing protein [Ignavibacteria bacterium]
MKRHESLALLSSDHHQGLSIAKMLRSKERIKALGTEAVYNKLSDFFHNELTGHFSEEENFLAPWLRDNLLIKRMCREHNELRRIFVSMSAAGDLENTLQSFGELLESHIRFEERELFPMIESTLPESTLIRIGSSIKLSKRAI